MTEPDRTQHDTRPKGLWWLLGLQWPLVVVAAMSSTLAAALALVPFLLVAKMSTAIYAVPADLHAVFRLSMVAAVALFVRYAFVAIANMVAHTAAFRVLHILRVRLAKKLGAVPLSFFSMHHAGELRKTLMDDVNAIEGFIAHHFPDAVAAFVVPISMAVVLLWADWRMALVSFLMGPIAIVVMGIAMRGIGAAHAKWNDIQDRLNRSLLEYVRGIHVIKTFGLSAQRFGDLSRTMDEGLAWMEGFMRTNGRGYGAFATIIGASLLVLVPVGGWLYHHGSLSLDVLVLFLILGPQLLMSLMRLIFAWGGVSRIAGANERIQAILMAPDLEKTTEGKTPAHTGLAFRDVYFSYGGDERTVIHGVSFEAPAGKVTALVGPSGAGKSTLVHLVPRLWEVTSGDVTLGGVRVNALPLDDLLSRVSLVFQDVFLFHGTVKDNLLLARPDATDDEIDAACRAARAYDFIQALPDGYETMLGEQGARLSGGEKQRLSIARALLKDAPILLLDEATAFADPENEAHIQDALSALCVDRTVVVIAHRLSTIRTADQIVVLDKGRVKDIGTHAELVERCPLYQELWANHMAAMDWSLGDPAFPGEAAEVGA